MKIIVLGSAQDGGFPQWDCNCTNCNLSRNGRLNSRLRSSLALKDEQNNFIVLDASSDLKWQVEIARLKFKMHRSSSRFPPVDAILITHAHWGHIMGLLEFSAGYPFQIPVYCSSYVSSIIQNSCIFKSLVTEGFIRIVEFNDNPIRIIGCKGSETEFTLKAFRVKHREDFTDTHGFKIYHENLVVAYVPDIKLLSDCIIRELEDVDVLFFEGTFFRDDELWRVSGIRKTSRELGHIPITESLSILGGLDIPFKYYIHVNHTNPVLRSDSDERKIVEDAGFKIADDGLVIGT